jgi:hypothetical protein
MYPKSVATTSSEVVTEVRSTVYKSETYQKRSGGVESVSEGRSGLSWEVRGGRVSVGK